MTSNFRLDKNKIILKNDGESFGYLRETKYNIGEKLFEFMLMDYKDMDKLKELYSNLIQIVCDTKINNRSGETFMNMCEAVYNCLEFSPYTHFYNQILIDTIVKTYNTETIRSDIPLKAGVDIDFDDEEFYPDEDFMEREEDTYCIQTIGHEWGQKIDEVSKKEQKICLKFFEIVKDELIKDLFNKREDLIKRVSLISEYSNNTAVRQLTSGQRIYLYELKKLFNLNYLNTNPSHAIFLDTVFKTKHIPNNILEKSEKELELTELANKIAEKSIEAQEVYELDNTEQQIRFELFQVIKNNFTIKKCKNCGKLFIPSGRNDKQYCDNLYLDTGKTCSEIGAINTHKGKLRDSSILKEFQREYKRMYGLHYSNYKVFKEKQFKDWSKNAIELRKNYEDNQLEEFKIELKKLSDSYWEV